METGMHDCSCNGMSTSSCKVHLDYTKTTQLISMKYDQVGGLRKKLFNIKDKLNDGVGREH